MPIALFYISSICVQNSIETVQFEPKDKENVDVSYTNSNCIIYQLFNA